jgi:hypothetical protein
MARKAARKNKSTESDLRQIRDTEHKAIIMMVYFDEVEHRDGLFEHLGYDRRPTLMQFRSRYVKRGKVDFDKLMSDVWNYEPTATRWRAQLEAAGLTAERILHDIVDRIARWEQLSPQPPELRDLRDLRDKIMARNPIPKH